MKAREEQKNKKLADKFASHSVNLLNLEPGTEEFRKERRKAHRAGNRFLAYVRKSIKRV